jgi:hypothetical protein
MSNIITTEEPLIDLDPESLIDNVELNDQQKRLDVIKDLDNLLSAIEHNNAAITAINTNTTKTNNQAKCFISIQNDKNQKIYNGIYLLHEMMQPSFRNSPFEIVIGGDTTRLINLFSFLQKNIYIKKNSKRVRLFGNKTLLSLNKNRVKKNKLIINKFEIYHQKNKINLLNIESWIITEVKYVFEKNESQLKLFISQK